MNFKNELEEKAFRIAEILLGSTVELQHNKVIKIETAVMPETASFAGPPKKEIDVLVAKLRSDPDIVLLVSCKEFEGKAEPAHVQEWVAVVKTMSKYSDKTRYLGLVLSPSGFTSGCEAWASTHNLGLIPPIKGNRMTFPREMALKMYERALWGIAKRVKLAYEDLLQEPAFFDLTFRLVADFEGHLEAETDSRYRLMPGDWASSFGEMINMVRGRAIVQLCSKDGGPILLLDNEMFVHGAGDRISFGKPHPGDLTDGLDLQCFKNFSGQTTDIEALRQHVKGRFVTSAADFRTYLELGVDSKFNLGLHPNGLHIVSVEHPSDADVL
jgi:hypothetical protein